MRLHWVGARSDGRCASSWDDGSGLDAEFRVCLDRSACFCKRVSIFSLRVLVREQEVEDLADLLSSFGVLVTELWYSSFASFGPATRLDGCACLQNLMRQIGVLRDIGASR